MNDKLGSISNENMEVQVHLLQEDSDPKQEEILHNRTVEVKKDSKAI